MDVNESQWRHAKITPAKITQMCASRPPEDVAEDLKIPVSEVLAVLAQTEDGKKAHVPVTVLCLDSRRIWRARGWRGAYLLAQLQGLSNWTWCTTASFDAWREAQQA